MATEQVDTRTSTPPPKRPCPLAAEDRQYSETDVCINNDGTVQYQHMTADVGKVSKESLNVLGAIPNSSLDNVTRCLMQRQVPKWIKFTDVS